MTTTGVSVAFTVLACDAGPVFLQEQVAVPEDEQAPQLLERLFKQGAQMLVHNIDRVWAGEAAEVAWQQDHQQTTHAAKVSLRLDSSQCYVFCCCQDSMTTFIVSMCIQQLHSWCF